MLKIPSIKAEVRIIEHRGVLFLTLRYDNISTLPLFASIDPDEE